MKENSDCTIKELEKATRQTPLGGEYWMGRDIQQIFGYSNWQNFEDAIKRSRMACESTGENGGNHFIDTSKMITVGKGAMVQRRDYFLDRYACYLIAMNGDSKKPEIGTAQTYFAIQTRKQELQDKLTEGKRRLELRERVTNRNKSLIEVAQKAGVKKYGVFHNAGYHGQYGMVLADIKKAKGLPPTANLLDHAGRTELAANEFRITQTEDKLTREKIIGEQKAINTHFDVGKEVRATINKLGGTMPENLPTEPSIKKLTSKLKKIDKELAKGEVIL